MGWVIYLDDVNYPADGNGSVQPSSLCFCSGPPVLLLNLSATGDPLLRMSPIAEVC